MFVVDQKGTDFFFLLPLLQPGSLWQHFASLDNHLDITIDSFKAVLHSVEQNAWLGSWVED